MASDYDKQHWQAEQAARDAAMDKQREKERKTRERAARNAQRKLERLHRTLREKDDLTDFEEEFAESVTERLDRFGSAFHDLEKGRPGDALSFAQKRVVAAMNRKVKDLKKEQRQQALSGSGDGGEEQTREQPRPRSSFKSKGKPKWTPRVRQLDEDFGAPPPDDVYLPKRHEERASPSITHERDQEPHRPPVGKPFLRIVKNN